MPSLCVCEIFTSCRGQICMELHLHPLYAYTTLRLAQWPLWRFNLFETLCYVSFVINLSQSYDNFSYVKIQVKQPVQAWTGPEGLRRLGSQISRKSALERGKIVSPTHRPLLSVKKYCWYSFLLEAVTLSTVAVTLFLCLRTTVGWCTREMPLKLHTV
jgi:hypothetical protein